jgi:hypothetical protein
MELRNILVCPSSSVFTRWHIVDVLTIRSELRRKTPGELFRLVANQRIPKCLIGGTVCCYYLRYGEAGFCISELLGQGCQLERLRKLEEVHPCDEEAGPFLPFKKKMDMEPAGPGRKVLEFKVCYKHGPIQFLGKIAERRKKERVDNLRDLLDKAIRDFSDQVEDPSGIFLLGP